MKHESNQRICARTLVGSPASLVLRIGSRRPAAQPLCDEAQYCAGANADGLLFQAADDPWCIHALTAVFGQWGHGDAGSTVPAHTAPSSCSCRTAVDCATGMFAALYCTHRPDPCHPPISTDGHVLIHLVPDFYAFLARCAREGLAKSVGLAFPIARLPVKLRECAFPDSGRYTALDKGYAQALARGELVALLLRQPFLCPATWRGCRPMISSCSAQRSTMTKSRVSLHPAHAVDFLVDQMRFGPISLSRLSSPVRCGAPLAPVWRDRSTLLLVPVLSSSCTAVLSRAQCETASGLARRACSFAAC